MTTTKLKVKQEISCSSFSFLITGDEFRKMSIVRTGGRTYLNPEYFEDFGIFFFWFLGTLGGRFLQGVDIIKDGRNGVDVFDRAQISDCWHFNVRVLFDI